MSPEITREEFVDIITTTVNAAVSKAVPAAVEAAVPAAVEAAVPAAVNEAMGKFRKTWTEDLIAVSNRSERAHKRIRKDIKNLSTRTGRLEDHAVRVDVKLDRIETRLDQIETRLDGVETRLGGVEVKLDNTNGVLEAHILNPKIHAKSLT